MFATGHVDGVVQLWDAATFESRGALTGQSPTVASVAMSPNGTTVAVAAVDGVVRLRDITPTTPEAAISHLCRVLGPDFVLVETGANIPVPDGVGGWNHRPVLPRVARFPRSS